jgi:hypothetical protein
MIFTSKKQNKKSSYWYLVLKRLRTLEIDFLCMLQANKKFSFQLDELTDLFWKAQFLLWDSSKGFKELRNFCLLDS